MTGLRWREGANPRGCKIVTQPYPGFPTDMQAQMCALFATTPGISVVTETIFQQRFMHLAEMTRMGGAGADRGGDRGDQRGGEAGGGAGDGGVI